MQVITAGCVKRDILLIHFFCAEVITEIHRQREFLCTRCFCIIYRLSRLYHDLFAYNLVSVINRLSLK
jgi:hypothetical protein